MQHDRGRTRWLVGSPPHAPPTLGHLTQPMHPMHLMHSIDPHMHPCSPGCRAAVLRVAVEMEDGSVFVLDTTDPTLWQVHYSVYGVYGVHTCMGVWVHGCMECMACRCVLAQCCGTIFFTERPMTTPVSGGHMHRYSPYSHHSIPYTPYTHASHATYATLAPCEPCHPPMHHMHAVPLDWGGSTDTGPEAWNSARLMHPEPTAPTGMQVLHILCTPCIHPMRTPYAPIHHITLCIHPMSHTPCTPCIPCTHTPYASTHALVGVGERFGRGSWHLEAHAVATAQGHRYVCPQASPAPYAPMHVVGAWM